MIDHISLNVSDITTSKEFYLKALEPLGYKTHMEMPEWNLLGLGRESQTSGYSLPGVSRRPT